MRDSAGLTLLETIIAIAICAIVLGTLATVSTSSLRQSRLGAYKTQSTQVLDSMGRRIAGGLDQSLLLSGGEVLTLNGAEVDDLMDLTGFVDEAFEVTIENLGAYRVGTTTLWRYLIEVCHDGGSSPSCVSSVTLANERTD